MPKIKNYSIDQLYERLFSLLNEHGLTYADIKNEFEAPRSKPVNNLGFTFAKGKVLPTRLNFTAESIQNGSYAEDTPSLKAWFERGFRNSSIYEHLGDYDVINNIQSDDQIEFNAINGKLFLMNDGNHRLFNYLLLAIINQKTAKTGKDIIESRKRFTLNKDVHFEHPKTLIAALDDYEDESNPQLSLNASEYVQETLINSEIEGFIQTNYLTYDHTTKRYNLHLNAKEYPNLTASMATKIIENEAILPKGFKVWKANDTFYALFHNRIFHTTDVDCFRSMSKDLHDKMINNEAPLYSGDFLVISNGDLPDHQNTTIKTSARSYDIYTTPGLTREHVLAYKDYLEDNLASISNNLLKKDIIALRKIIDSKDSTCIDLPELEFYGLSQNQIDEIEEFLIKGLKYLTPKYEEELAQDEE